MIAGIQLAESLNSKRVNAAIALAPDIAVPGMESVVGPGMHINSILVFLVQVIFSQSHRSLPGECQRRRSNLCLVLLPIEE